MRSFRDVPGICAAIARNLTARLAIFLALRRSLAKMSVPKNMPVDAGRAEVPPGSAATARV